MKLQISTTFSFSKLASKMPKIIENTTKGLSRSGAVGIKKSIESGRFKALSPTTIDIRKSGASPNSNYLATSSTKPLIHTGRLRDSIKSNKEGVEMLKYGMYQNKGYKTATNRFTKNYFMRTGKNLAGKNVSARPFIDQGILIKTKENENVFKNFSRAIKRALKK